MYVHEKPLGEYILRHNNCEVRKDIATAKSKKIAIFDDPTFIVMPHIPTSFLFRLKFRGVPFGVDP